jgi:hypothetical protein
LVERDKYLTVRERWEGRHVKPKTVTYRFAEEARASLSGFVSWVLKCAGEGVEGPKVSQSPDGKRKLLGGSGFAIGSGKLQ